MKLAPAVAVAVTLGAAALVHTLPVPSPSQDLGATTKYDQALEERTAVPRLLNLFVDGSREVAQTLLSSPSKVDTLSASSPEADELVSTKLSLGPAQDYHTGTTSSMATSSNRPRAELLTPPSEVNLAMQPARPVAQYGQTPTWLSRPQNPFAPESGLVKPQVGSTKSGFRRVQAAADSSQPKTEPSLRVLVTGKRKPARRTDNGRLYSRTHAAKRDRRKIMEAIRVDPNVPDDVRKAMGEELDRQKQLGRARDAKYRNGPKHGVILEAKRVKRRQRKARMKEQQQI